MGALRFALVIALIMIVLIILNQTNGIEKGQGKVTRGAYSEGVGAGKLGDPY